MSYLGVETLPVVILPPAPSTATSSQPSQPGSTDPRFRAPIAKGALPLTVVQPGATQTIVLPAPLQTPIVLLPYTPPVPTLLTIVTSKNTDSSKPNQQKNIDAGEPISGSQSNTKSSSSAPTPLTSDTPNADVAATSSASQPTTTDVNFGASVSGQQTQASVPESENDTSQILAQFFRTRLAM